MKLVYIPMFNSLLLILLNVYLGMKLLSHIVVSCLVFWKINTIFNSSCTILHSPKQCRRVPISLYPCHLFSFLLNIHFIGIKWYLIVAIICISLMTNDIEHLFMYLFSSVQLLSHVQLFATPWTIACQASLSITNSQSLLKLMTI